MAPLAWFDGGPMVTWSCRLLGAGQSGLGSDLSMEQPWRARSETRRCPTNAVMNSRHNLHAARICLVQVLDGALLTWQPWTRIVSHCQPPRSKQARSPTTTDRQADRQTDRQTKGARRIMASHRGPSPSYGPIPSSLARDETNHKITLTRDTAHPTRQRTERVVHRERERERDKPS